MAAMRAVNAIRIHLLRVVDTGTEFRHRLAVPHVFDGFFFQLIFTLLLPSLISQIIEMYKHLKESKELILSGFRKAHITEAVTQASNLSHLCENPFQDIDI